ncbi:MAG TPA: 2-C-methyl-D-erythritol 4-phosphate cytidylyltransferase [Balneolaceae bacterium]|nr:2-C-methyl-D-erythritol 4-phosphate cytidylyltransferase [Balneolaceae bacterium]
MSHLALIIPAAGSGKRMKSRLPKPYMKIAGDPVLKHTLLCFQNLPDLKQVVISTAAEYTSEALKIAKRVFPNLAVSCVTGGSKRQDSIQKALSSIESSVEYVIVHDAVRPFVEHLSIEKCLETAKISGAAILSIPARDTIKVADKKRIVQSTPDRRTVWQAQTPQIFKKEILDRAYAYAKSTGYIGTDDASLVEHLGENVTLVEGSYKNFKITYPADMKYAELLITGEN